MPDLFMRMSASSKAVTLGVGLLLSALAVHFRDKDVTAKAILVIVFFLLKAPVAAHVLARAAHRIGVPLWEETFVDELREHYQREPETLPEAGADDPSRAPDAP
jgi:multicomponent Na+:H+ antiporter subunit G